MEESARPAASASSTLGIAPARRFLVVSSASEEEAQPPPDETETRSSLANSNISSTNHQQPTTSTHQEPTSPILQQQPQQQQQQQPRTTTAAACSSTSTTDGAPDHPGGGKDGGQQQLQRRMCGAATTTTTIYGDDSISKEDAAAIQRALHDDDDEVILDEQEKQEQSSLQLAWELQALEEEQLQIRPKNVYYYPSSAKHPRGRPSSSLVLRERAPQQPRSSTASTSLIREQATIIRNNQGGDQHHSSNNTSVRNQRRNIRIILLCCCFLAFGGILLGAGYKLGTLSRDESTRSPDDRIPLPRVNSLLNMCQTNNNNSQDNEPISFQKKNVTVAAYYYPWYGRWQNSSDNANKKHFHGGQYLRQHLRPRQQPALGEYDDSDPRVIAAHLCWSRYAGVDAWITSWWGPDTYTDTTTRNVILPHPDLGTLKIAVHYESKGRAKDPKSGLTNWTLLLERAGPDVAHLCEHYFSHPNYLRVANDGRPVVVVYLSRILEGAGLMRETAAIMQEAARQCGEPRGLFLVGDHAFQTNFIPLEYLNAITNYDVYGSLTSMVGNYAHQTGVDAYAADQQEWRDRAHAADVQYIPAATPGFNDRAMSNPHTALSRKLDPNAPLGSLFVASLEQAIQMVDASAGNLLFVTSWNEWHEDTVRTFSS